MLPSILWISILTFSIAQLVLFVDSLTLVDRTHLPRRRSSPARKLRLSYHRDTPSLMDNVIHSPLDNKRIFTKDSFYINAIQPKEKEAILYEKMLMDGKGSINDIDSFFVTVPPARTTLAPKRSGDNDLPELETVRVSQSSIKDEEVEERNQRPVDLKLVTLPPLSASTVAPFKHNSLVRRQLSEQQQHQQNFLAQQNNIRFPAQPWQIPPLHPSTTPNPLLQFFQPIQAPQHQTPVIPPNPFLTQQLLLQPQSPLQQQSQQQSPPPNFWATPQLRNDTFDPYVPIQISNPPYLFQQPSRQVVDAHRQPIRLGGFARNVGQQPIPLPAPAQFQTAFNQEKEREFNNFAPNQFAKKATPPIDYSVDSVAIVNKDVQPPPPVTREVPGKASEHLRNFVKVHPHVINNMQKPLIYRGREMVIPKMFNFTQSPPPAFTQTPPSAPPQTNYFPPQQFTAQQSLPPPIVAVTQMPSYVPLMNPNQKLDLCCRKQRISPVCQNLCNFDSFNDKTLVSAFITNQCPGPQLGQAYDCASSKADHSPCCERAGLSSFGGGKCMAFCRTHVATPSNILDYFICLQVFETIKGCYREYQFNHPNIYGD